MSKENERIFNLNLLKNFFNARIHIWIIVSSIILVFCIYFYYSSFQPVIIFPQRNNFTFEFYTDSANGGHSAILYHNISDSTLDLDFVLKEGFMAPYVGIAILNIQNRVFSLKPYNQLRLDIESENIKSFGFDIYAANAYGDTNARNNGICFYHNFDISASRNQYVIKFDELKIAEWWYRANTIPADEKIEPDFEYVYRIDFGPSLTSASEEKHSLRIYSISFERNNATLMFILMSAEFLLVFILSIIHYVNSYYRNKKLPVEITYKTVDIEKENHQINNFLHYINEHYSDPRLTLQQVSNQTGINPRRVATSIQQIFRCNFKTYLNRLRINESKRLLKESKLNMGEIAFKVGFNNQTHFNRVFRSLEGVSPTEFLESKPQ